MKIIVVINKTIKTPLIINFILKLFKQYKVRCSQALKEVLFYLMNIWYIHHQFIIYKQWVELGLVH